MVWKFRVKLRIARYGTYPDVIEISGNRPNRRDDESYVDSRSTHTEMHATLEFVLVLHALNSTRMLNGLTDLVGGMLEATRRVVVIC